MGQPQSPKIIVSQWVQKLGATSSQSQICLSVLVQERGRVEAAVTDMQQQNDTFLDQQVNSNWARAPIFSENAKEKKSRVNQLLEMINQKNNDPREKKGQLTSKHGYCTRRGHRYPVPPSSRNSDCRQWCHSRDTVQGHAAQCCTWDRYT